MCYHRMIFLTPSWHLMFLFLLFSCSQTEPTTSLLCEEMDRAQCMSSDTCTLSLSDTPDVYLCQDAQGICEEGIVQSDLYGTNGLGIACDDSIGCTAVGGECYCSCKGYGETSVPDGEDVEDCNCMCSGGEPPSCVPQE